MIRNSKAYTAPQRYLERPMLSSCPTGASTNSRNSSIILCWTGWASCQRLGCTTLRSVMMIFLECHIVSIRIARYLAELHTRYVRLSYRYPSERRAWVCLGARRTKDVDQGDTLRQPGLDSKPYGRAAVHSVFCRQRKKFYFTNRGCSSVGIKGLESALPVPRALM